MDEEHLFYKYMSGATARIVLMKQTLRWSTPAALNDPFDMQVDLRPDIDVAVVRSMALEKAWQGLHGPSKWPSEKWLGIPLPQIPDGVRALSRAQFERVIGSAIDEGLSSLDTFVTRIQEANRNSLSNGKVLCLTKSATNTLMWSHYADSHRGVVIRFRDRPELGTPYGMAKPINYVDDMPRLFDEDTIADVLIGRAAPDPRSSIQNIVYTKSKSWTYENEWRIYSGNGRNHGATHEDLTFGSTELDAVIFGARMLDHEKASLAEIVRQQYPHAELLQCYLPSGSLAISVATWTAPIGRTDDSQSVS